MSNIFQITSVMWPFIMKFCTLKLLWIFLFIIILTTIFLIIMYKGQKDELKKYILDGHKLTKNTQAIAICDGVHSQLKDLVENLSEKEEQLKKSRSGFECAEKVLDLIENNQISSVNRYKELLFDLKEDLEKIENEVKELQTEITGLSKQRENLKIDVQQQQGDYQRLFYALAKEFNIESSPVISNPLLKLNITASDSTD